MTDDDRPVFARALYALAETMAEPMSELRAEGYFAALEDLPTGVVIGAVKQALLSCKFFPKPAELRTLAAGGDDEIRVEEAWLALRRAMREVGSYASVVFEDAALVDTVTAMFDHWPGACLTDLSPEMWASTRKAFGRVYRVQLGRAPTGVRYLTGICERDNHARMQAQKFVEVKRVEARTGASQRLSLPEAEAARQLAGVPTMQPRGRLVEVVQRALAASQE